MSTALPELPKRDHAFEDLDGDRPAILVWNAASMRAYASLAVRDHQAEIERLQQLVYVPGLWRCPKCEFNLMRTALNVVTGTASADDTTGEKCPNCQSPLWRVTERDAGNDLAERLDKLQPSEGHHQLFTFYGVTTLHALVDAQARHIERLQQQLLQVPAFYDRARTPRDG